MGGYLVRSNIERGVILASASRIGRWWVWVDIHINHWQLSVFVLVTISNSTYSSLYHLLHHLHPPCREVPVLFS